MKPTRKLLFILLALFFLLFSLSGCADDEGDSEKNEGVVQVWVDNLEEEAFITAESSYTLSGAAYLSTEVRVNGVPAEAGESILEDFFLWTSEISLEEGDNSFTIIAVDAKGRESDPLTATVTLDPDYTPEPPENDSVMTNRLDLCVAWSQIPSSPNNLERKITLIISNRGEYSELTKNYDLTGKDAFREYEEYPCPDGQEYLVTVVAESGLAKNSFYELKKCNVPRIGTTNSLSLYDQSNNISHYVGVGIWKN